MTRILTVSRAVVQVDPKFDPDGRRFLVKEYPKDGEYRCLKLSKQLAGKVAAHIKDASIGPDDLIFAMPLQDSPAARLRAVPDPAALSFTKPNAAGRQYRHGTMSGYNAGRCRCGFCKDAAAIYRAQRRSAGKDSPRRPRTVDTDGHIPRDWFRLKVWKPALERAGITFNVRAHDMRHAHASWLQMSGVASAASFGRSRERVPPAAQRAALGQAGVVGARGTLCDLGCHRPLASGRTMMQPVRLQRIPA